MSDHLSQDQKARWLLGQASPEEEEHRKNCPLCDSELLHFRQTVGTFQHVMKTWSEREGGWRTDDAAEILSWQPRRLRTGRLALATAAVALVVLLVAYPRVDVEHQEVPEASPAVISDDAQLMEAVATHLSRPMPAPMERVLALLPTQEFVIELTEREELR